mmetsp:Transcript_16832/g.24970  ORF Transcript_16832/g.24970 Transcript_16832/m.24970 type:complete len:200 (-) Transcript_16832:175-774(-)
MLQLRRQHTAQCTQNMLRTRRETVCGLKQPPHHDTIHVDTPLCIRSVAVIVDYLDIIIHCHHHIVDIDIRFIHIHTSIRSSREGIQSISNALGTDNAHLTRFEGDHHTRTNRIVIQRYIAQTMQGNAWCMHGKRHGGNRLNVQILWWSELQHNVSSWCRCCTTTNPHSIIVVVIVIVTTKTTMYDTKPNHIASILRYID